MPLDLTDDKSTLVQVMAWCRQATNHYLSQCWLRFMLPNGVTRPQLEWLERLRSEPHDYPFYQIGSQVKRRQSRSYKFKEFAKISNFWMLKQTLHATHLLKLFDKMCKYEMDPMSIVEETERTRLILSTDGQTDKVKPVYPPFNFVEAGGYNELMLGIPTPSR